MAYGYEGKLVRLVPLDIDRHLDNACRWVNDPEITHHLCIGHYPMTKLAERDWFESRSRTTDDFSFAIETLDGMHIGFSGLHQIDYRNGVAHTGTFIGIKDEWGKGFGTDSVKVRSRYAFEVLGLRLLLSAVFEGNDRSLKMQTKAGYKIAGTIPDRWWKNGCYRDEIMTYLTREDWLALDST